MSTYSEMKEIPTKYLIYRDKLTLLLKKYDIKSIKNLLKVYKSDSEFKSEWKSIWIQIAKADGGKLSLTSIGIIIGSALGGVGIAAMGSAIGMPLALILGLSGFVIGNKMDDNSISINLSDDLLSKLEKDSMYIKISVSELVEHLIEQTYTTLQTSLDDTVKKNSYQEDDEIGFMENTINLWTNTEYINDTLSKEQPPLLDDEDLPEEVMTSSSYEDEIIYLKEIIEELTIENEQLREDNTRLFLSSE